MFLGILECACDRQFELVQGACMCTDTLSVHTTMNVYMLLVRNNFSFNSNLGHSSVVLAIIHIVFDNVVLTKAIVMCGTS